MDTNMAAGSTVDEGGLARALGIAREAVELHFRSEVVDLHIDSFIWSRILGYRLGQRHHGGLLGARFFNQVDIPRLLSGHVTGGVWSVTTTPLRGPEARRRTFIRNKARLVTELQHAGNVELVKDLRGFQAARQKGLHAAFLAIQGGNALEAEVADGLPSLGEDVLRVTLVHLSTSAIGATSSPLSSLAGGRGLTNTGREMVRALNQRRVFVDLAHISAQGFWDAVDVHDRGQPLMVSHTGVQGVHRHWRNLDDAQIRAVADTGGVVGVMYQSSFLGDPLWSGRAASIVDHLEHIIHVAGEDAAALGSDWDGMIVPPTDMPTCVELPKLTALMLSRGWPVERVQKVLGGNFLRTLGLLRGQG